jgi:hypothetical protein
MLRMAPLFLILAATTLPPAQAQAPAPRSLRIVVIEGEGAVNIIQQKTAVAPIVEVRDQNNLPVGGATVTFTIQGANTAVFAGGSPTLTVTTNAAGRAIAAAVNPLSSGSVQIQAAAAFQGQTAAATITQTNVLTASQAGSAAAGGGASGGGGGLGGGAIAGISGGVAAAGAAAVLSQQRDAEEEDAAGDNNPQTTSIDPAVAAALGTYTLQTVNGAGMPAITVTSPPATCAVITDNATLTLSANGSERNYQVVETSRTQCTLGPNSNFQSATSGRWSISGSTVTFTGTSDNFVLDTATFSGSTLTMTVRPPHIDAGREAPRVNTVWRK